MRKVVLLRHVPLNLKAFISLLFLSIFLFTGSLVNAQSSDEEEDPAVEIHSHNDIQRGERFLKAYCLKIANLNPANLVISCRNRIR